MFAGLLLGCLSSHGVGGCLCERIWGFTFLPFAKDSPLLPLVEFKGNLSLEYVLICSKGPKTKWLWVKTHGTILG